VCADIERVIEAHEAVMADYNRELAARDLRARLDGMTG
jgi:hypothetical protein